MKSHNFCSLVWACAIALGSMNSAQAQSDSDLRNDQATPGDVTTHGMGYNNQRYSTLKGINKGNVDKMVPMWTYNLNNLHGQESQPIIFDGMMFVTTHTATIAIDPLTGRQIWKQDLEFASDVFKMAC
jgi:alcohol dehydrogenase (cytochrome c)